jgi:uncharacterized protein (DUF305 family)
MILVVMRIALIAAAVLGTAQSIGAQATPVRTSDQAIAKARADSIRRPYTKADIDFVSGMIHHHAQAILMSKMAPTHGAANSILTLTARIINAQQDEIRIMQQWLIDRGQPVPQPNPYGMPMDMGGMSHEMLMPGMLTREQLARLDSARGPEFDLYFLKDMVQHHTGAVAMVKTLFASPGAGQDETIFKVASDINVDQSTEIARMNRMLLAIALGEPY